MDSIFLLSEEDRTNFLQHIKQSFGCTYICLWSYLPQPSNCLLFLDGLYHEEDGQPSSSSGSLARRLFDEYRLSLIIINDGHVPGFAFKNNLPYVELKVSDLARMVSTQVQLQFYQEARIKAAVFMGCNTGEIELGISNESQVNLEMELKNWFPEDFSRQTLPRELPQPTEPNRPSSSSSSLRSLSIDSPEPSPFQFNIPHTSYIQEHPIEPPLQKALRPTISTTSSSIQQQIHALSQMRNILFPTIESEDAAMTKAILAVISSPSSSSSSHQPQASQTAPSAFQRYRSALAPTAKITTSVRRQHILKRAISFFASLNVMRIGQGQMQGSRPTSTQLHHMISERRRREKLNESFQALRSLLPPGSKRDKASVLSNTKDYLTSLKAQVEELSKRNTILEAQLPRKEATDQESTVTSSERLNVRITQIAESTSEARIVDLEVNARGENVMLDMVIRVMEFLKQVENVTLMSVEAEMRMVETTSFNRLILRLKIEGGEWDESAFLEAVRRVIDDLAQ